jgi:hypothetical protein
MGESDDAWPAAAADRNRRDLGHPARRRSGFVVRASERHCEAAKAPHGGGNGVFVKDPAVGLRVDRPALPKLNADEPTASPSFHFGVGYALVAL